MNTTFELGNLKVIDLTKPLDPKTESRRCHLIRYNTGGPIPDFHTAMDLTSHLGTHCECPYHHDDNWHQLLNFHLQHLWEEQSMLISRIHYLIEST